jgi:hypothetical protein
LYKYPHHFAPCEAHIPLKKRDMMTILLTLTEHYG